MNVSASSGMVSVARRGASNRTASAASRAKDGIATTIRPGNLSRSRRNPERSSRDHRSSRHRRPRKLPRLWFARRPQ